MKDNKKKIITNNRIRAREIRVIGSDGKQLGIMRTEEAIGLARKSNLDLVQVTDKASPPVCKIIDYGKYSYEQKKKEKSGKVKTGEIKGIRLGFGISEHDLTVRANLAKKFLEKGDKVRVEMKLKGRQKGLTSFAKEKTNKFLEILKELTPIKIERDIKIEPRGITLIISQDTKKYEAKN